VFNANFSIMVHSKAYRYTQNHTGTLKIIQVHSRPKDWKTKQSEVFGSKKIKGPKQDSQSLNYVNRIISAVKYINEVLLLNSARS
jgi:hypothetical protein